MSWTIRISIHIKRSKAALDHLEEVLRSNVSNLEHTVHEVCCPCPNARGSHEVSSCSKSDKRGLPTLHPSEQIEEEEQEVASSTNVADSETQSDVPETADVCLCVGAGAHEAMPGCGEAE